MIAIVDYGMGNLRSVLNAFEAIQAPVQLVSTAASLREATAIVVPGVGAFGDGMRNLKGLGLIEALEEAVLVRKTPYLGICLGLQFLAVRGLENDPCEGLGWLPGTVRPIVPGDRRFKVPHIGWNELEIARPCRLLDGLGEHPVFYFVHGYYFDPEEASDEVVVATTFHGQPLCAVVERDNIFGVQFHPEKSQECGLRLLKNFVALVEQTSDAGWIANGERGH